MQPPQHLESFKGKTTQTPELNAAVDLNHFEIAPAFTEIPNNAGAHQLHQRNLIFGEATEVRAFAYASGELTPGARQRVSQLRPILGGASAVCASGVLPSPQTQCQSD